MAMVLKNTTQPTMSSRAAIGISVEVTGPFVLNSRTMDKAGAGAVASAMPPNRKARYRGTPVSSFRLFPKAPCAFAERHDILKIYAHREETP